ERIGVVQGYAPEANLGNGPAAFENFKKSAAILSKLSASPGAAGDLRHDYVRVLNRLAPGYGSSGDVKTEEEIAHKAIDLSETALKAHPGDRLLMDEVASSLVTLADCYTGQEKYQEALTVRERVLELSQPLPGQQLGSQETRNLALAYKRVGALFGV